eukprot:9703260-Alexandrium_andersonii.AAC.1
MLADGLLAEGGEQDEPGCPEPDESDFATVAPFLDENDYANLADFDEGVLPAFEPAGCSPAVTPE